MDYQVSSVLQFDAPERGETAKIMENKLRFYTDAWDLAINLTAPPPRLIVIDARSLEAYGAGHIPGAISFPHRAMNAETAASFDRSKVNIIYCEGIGCNASTKGAYKLAQLGFRDGICSCFSNYYIFEAVFALSRLKRGDLK